MTAWHAARLTTWGRTRYARVSAASPANSGDLRDALESMDGQGIIAYGNGKCYGDASLNDGRQTLRTGQLNRILSFDPATRDVVCEAGVTFRDLAGRFFGDGYCYPVAAANSAVTIGGAFANDIHSKNHHAVGSFGDHTVWIDLMTADGTVHRCSREENPDLFRATLGGVGLTGIILRVCFRLLTIESSSVDATYTPISNLDAMLDAIDGARGSEDFLFGWIDAFATGPELGRGILEKGRFAIDNAGTVPAPKPWTVPLAPPSRLVPPAAIRWIVRRRYGAMPADGKAIRKPLFPFLFPLDHINGFNKLFGHRGFYSIHAGFPPESQRAGIRALLSAIAEAQAGSITSVVKPMRGPGEGLLSFPLKGMVFAIDLPRRPGVEALHAHLESLTLDHGGRLYLAKDALMAPETYATMFPKLDEFRTIAARVDPGGLFQSDLSRRLRLRG